MAVWHPGGRCLRAAGALAAWAALAKAVPDCDPARLAFAPAGRVELGELGPWSPGRRATGSRI